MPFKVLLINAINPNAEVQGRFPNLGLGYLASSLFHKFPPKTFDIRIIDRNLEGTICDFMPDLVGITAVSQNYNFAKQYAWTVKHFNDKKNIPVIIGGVHISALPQTITEDMDVAVIGEGEEVFPEIIRHYLETGKLHSMPESQPIEPLDNIHRPARHLLNIGYRAGIFSSRGCPYHCYFCSSCRFWGKVRFFSAEYVIEELKQIVADYKVKKISFYDDLMIADFERLHRLVELFNREKSLTKVKFKILARANLVTEQTAKLLSRMNVESVGMGLESGNQGMLSFLKGRGITVEDNYAAIVKLHKNGISAHASFIIGCPDETEKQIMDTYRFIKESDLDFFDIYVLTPYPETPAWEDAKANGLVNDNMDWSRLEVNFRNNHNPVILSKLLSRDQIETIYRKFKRERMLRAIRRVWFNPYWYDAFKLGENTLRQGIGRFLPWSCRDA